MSEITAGGWCAPSHRGKTSLQVAFNNAVESSAYRIVLDVIRDDPAVGAAIKDLLTPLIVALVDQRDGLAEAIGSAIGSWLRDRTT